MFAAVAFIFFLVPCLLVAFVVKYLIDTRRAAERAAAEAAALREELAAQRRLGEHH